MRILFAIPSKNRVEILDKNSYQWLRYIKNFDWKIFVEPQDEEKYVAQFGRLNILTIGENNKGLGYAKNCIQIYAKNNAYDLVFKIDDDIKCFTNFRKKTTPEQCAELIQNFCKESIENFKKYEMLGAVTFPYSFQMYEKSGYIPTKRIQTCYLCRTEFLAVREDINFFEDFAVGLNILVKGKKIMQYGMIGQDMGVKVGGGTGGMQSFNRKEESQKDINLLREIYPPLKFRKVDKPWEIEPDLSSVDL